MSKKVQFQTDLMDEDDEHSSGSSPTAEVELTAVTLHRTRPSALTRQKTRLFRAHSTAWHCFYLLSAIFMLLVNIGDVLTDWFLMYDFYRRDWFGAAAGLVIIHVLRALFNILFDYMNRGRLKFFLVDILQGRVLVEFVLYCKEWARHKGKPWATKEFRSAICFESFLSSMPALLVQTFVIMHDRENTTLIQIVAICLSSFQAGVDLLHFFKYVSLSYSVYFWQMFKAVFNSMLRTALVAWLVRELKVWTYVWVGGSLLLGLAVYVGAVRLARKHKRDDPLVFPRVHATFGLLVALHMCFISFPFAPTHSIRDWWWGYIASEIKINLENAAMVGVVAALWDGEHNLTFWSAIFFCGVMFVTNLTALIFLHKSVKDQLDARNLYSSALIVRLYDYLFKHFKDGVKRKRALKEGMDEEDEEEPAPLGDDALAELDRLATAQSATPQAHVEVTVV